MSAVNDSEDFFGRIAHTPEDDLEIPAGVKRDRWEGRLP